MKFLARLSILYIALAAGSVGWSAPLDPSRFLHTALDSHLITQNLPIATQMSDQANVAGVTLFFKSPDKASYTQKILQDAARTGVWKADVPSAELSPLGVNYYMEAAYRDGGVYRSRDYSTVILIVPPAIQEMMYRDDASKADVKIAQGELILKLDPSLPPDLVPNAINTLVLRHNGKVLAVNNPARLVRMQVPTHLDLNAVMGDLRAQSSVEFVHPHGLYELVLTPNDPRLGEQWAVPKIRLPGAWDATTGDASVIVGVIDTGRDPSHPDLQGKFLPGYDYYANDPDPTDAGGHGTMVSGVVGAAGNNGTGIAGTNWRCKILPYRTGDGFLSGWAIVQSIRAAADNGARVINMSFGSSAGWQAEHDALIYAYNKGVVLVAAAGNSGTPTPQYPAAYPEVIAAVATNSSDQKAAFSTYGNWVDVSAPGQDILTTTVGGGYRFVNGTSFASPYTAGVASLILSVNPQLTNDQVRQILRQTAVDLGAPGFDNTFGYGRIDAKAAVDAAVQSSGDETPPIIAHTPVRLTQAGISVTIQAAITDNAAVQSATVLYRRQGTAAFREALMQYLGRHIFEGVIPKDAVAPPAVEYAIQARDPKGNTSQTPVYTIAMIDNTPPVVQHAPPDSAESSLPLPVAATITDDVAVVSADLHARTKGGSHYERYPMKVGASGVYRAVLPDTLVRSPAIQYYFAATDTAGNRPAGGNPGSDILPHEVPVVVIDRTPPVITHTPIANGQLAGASVKVEARITDNVAVTGAMVYYRAQGKSGYDSAPMRLLAGDSYAAVIGGSAVVRPAIEYYIAARDAAGNRPPAGRTPGASSNPNVFIVAIDTIPPVIYHQSVGAPPDQLIDGIPAKLSAVVIDNRGLREAHLHYKKSGEPAKFSRPMTYTVSNRYEATLPDSAVQPSGLEYFLTAMDTDGNETQWGPVSVPVYKKISIVTPKGDTWAHWVPGIAQVLFRDSASGSFVRLAVPPFDTANFSWSPDYSKLVMAGKIGDSWLVYVVAYKETFPTAYQVTDGDWTDLFPSWSADGKYLLFASNRDGDWDIFMKEWDSDGDGIPDKKGNLIKLSTDGDSVSPGSGEILGVARLTMPRSGEIVRNQVRIIGGVFAVVEADGLSQVPAEAYRVEVGEGDSPATYRVIRQVDRPVNILFDEELALWDSSKSVPGRHRICLVVSGNRREVRDCATVWLPGLQISLRMDTTDIPAAQSSFTASGEVFYNYGPRAVNLPVTVGIRETGDTKIIRTDTYGKYATTFSTPSAAGYTLTASVSDTEGRRADTFLTFRVRPHGIVLAVTVDPAETYPLLVFRARGTAKYFDSRPLVNREVEFEIVQTFKRYYALTDTLGNCTIAMQAPLDPGEYTLHARVTDGVMRAETDTPFKVLVPPIDITEKISPPVTYVGAYVAVSGTAAYRLNHIPLMNAPVTITPVWPETEAVVRTDTMGRYIALIRAAQTPGTYVVQVKVSDGKSTAANQKDLMVLPTFGIGAPFKLIVSLRAIPDTPYRNQPVVLEGQVQYSYQQYQWPVDKADVTLSIDSAAGTWPEMVGPGDAGWFRRKIKAPSRPGIYTARAAATEKFGLRGDTRTMISVFPLHIRLTTLISDTVLPVRWPQGPMLTGNARYIEIDTAGADAAVSVRALSGAGAWGGRTEADGTFAIQPDFSRTSDSELYVVTVDDGIDSASDTKILWIDSDPILVRLALDTHVVPDAAGWRSGYGTIPQMTLTANFSHPKGFPVYREDEVQLTVLSQQTRSAVWNTAIRLNAIGPGAAVYAEDTYSIPIPKLPDTYLLEYKIRDRYGVGTETALFHVYMPPCTGVPSPPESEMEIVLDLDTTAVYPLQMVNATGALRYKDGNPYMADRPVQIENINTKDRWTANYLALVRRYQKPIQAPAKPGRYEIVAAVTEKGVLLTDKEILTVLDNTFSGTSPIPPPPPVSPVPPRPDTPASPLPDTPHSPLPPIPPAIDTKILVFAPALITAQAGDLIEIEGWAVYTTGGPVSRGTCNLYEFGLSKSLSNVPTSMTGKFRFTRFAAPARTTDYEVVVDDGKLKGKAPVRIAIPINGSPNPWQPLLPIPPDTKQIKIYDELYPVQSPDGKYIAYSRRRIGSGDPLNLFISRSDSFASAIQFTTEDAGDMFPAWSPDGKRIAFGSKRSGNYDIWVKEIDGTGDGAPDAAGRSWKVTSWDGEDNKPTWSLDGKHLAFHSDRTGNYDIYVQSSAGGGDATRLTQSDAYDGNPHWSADGKYIVFHSNRLGRMGAGVVSTGRASIGIVMDESGSIDGTQFERMVSALGKFVDNLPEDYSVSVTKFDHRTQYALDFTNDKARIKGVIGNRIYGGGTLLYEALQVSMEHMLARPDQRVIVAVTDGVSAIGSHSPDDIIAFARDNGVVIHSVFVSYSLYGYTTKPPRDLIRIAESTGGKLIEVDGFENLEGGLRSTLLTHNRLLVNFNLWYMPAVGGEVKQLTDHVADDLYPAFSPDSKKIAFVSFRTGRGDIYVLKFNPDSSEPPLPPDLPPPPAPLPPMPPDTGQPPPDTGHPQPPDTDRLNPTLSWYPSGMQDDDTTVLFQLRNMSNNRRDVARGVLVRPFVLNGAEYVDTVMFDTYDLGTMAAVDTRPVRLTIMTNRKWESEKKSSASIRIELRVVQELNWPRHNIGVSARYLLVRPHRGGKAEELASITAVGGSAVRWRLVAEVGNPEATDRVVNLERALPREVRLTDIRLTGGTASIEENAGGSKLRIRDLPLRAGETFTIQCILESDSVSLPEPTRQKILMDLESEGWIRTDREGKVSIARKRGVRGKILGGDTSALVTLYDVTAGNRKKLAEVRANDTGEFDPPEIPDGVKTLVIRIEKPKSYPVFKRVEVSEGKVLHVVGTLAPDTIDSKGHSHRVDQPDSRQEVAVGNAEDRARIDIPGRALDREYYVTMRDPKNIVEIEAAARASGQRLLVAKEYILIDAQTGEEIHSGFAKRIKVGLSVFGMKAGEVAKLAYFNAVSGQFESTSGVIDSEKSEIAADVEHFSVYVSLAAPAPIAAPSFSDFSQLLVYPNPYEASYGTNKIIFENVPAGSILTIYTIAGEKVADITNDGGGDVNGSTRGSAAAAHIGWDLTNRSGRQVASGMYLFLLKDNSGNIQKGRVGVVR